MPAVSPDTFPASIDSPSMRHAGRELLSLAMMDARNHSLHLLAHFEQAIGERALNVPQRPELELPAWLAGHVAWTAEYWIGRNPQRSLGPACPPDTVRLASIEPMDDRWFNPALVQHPQPQPPPVDIAAKRPGPQPLVPVHNVGCSTARIVDVIARLHFWNFQRGPGPAPPIAGAP